MAVEATGYNDWALLFFQEGTDRSISPLLTVSGRNGF